MPYKPHDIPETASVLGVAFIVGFVAQFLKQKVDINISNSNIFWLSLAAGFSAMVLIGLVYEYTDFSAAFLIAISGIAGWTGVSLINTFSKLLDKAVINKAEQHLNLPKDTPTEGVIQDDSIPTRVNSQIE